MWKIVVAFVVFAALAMFVLMKSGGDIDMGGEKHGIDAEHTDEVHSSEPAPVAASEAASGASQ